MLRVITFLSLFVTELCFAGITIDDKLTCTVAYSSNPSVSIGAVTAPGSSISLAMFSGDIRLINLKNPDGTDTNIFVYEKLISLTSTGASTIVLATETTRGEFSEIIVATEVGDKKTSIKFLSGRNISKINSDGSRTRDFVPKLDYILKCDQS